MSNWYALLARAVNGSSQADIAAELGVSRTTVSLLLAGKYPGGTERMAARIMEKLGRRECPLESRTISTAACEEKQNEAMPTSSPAALRRWRECQQCKHHNHH